MNGSHNELREDAIYEKVCRFFDKCNQMKDIKDSFDTEESKIFYQRGQIKENSKIIMESVRSRSSKSSLSEEEDLKKKIKKLFKTYLI